MINRIISHDFLVTRQMLDDDFIEHFLFALMDQKTKKHSMGTYLGQNFLIDSKIRSYIADKISSLYHQTGCEALIEIGPGKGSITKLIQNISDNFFVVEKDENMFENLKFHIQNLKLIEGDVLEVDVQKFLSEKNLQPSQTLVVGNLPYYITSPILRKFFTDDGGGYLSDDTRRFDPEDFGGFKGRFAGGVFMVQDEVGQKLRSDAKKKSYLWRLLNYTYDVTYLKTVAAKCFKPAPKVKSCLIELRIKNAECRIEWNRLIEFLELFAPFSRKTLGAIATMIGKHGGRLRKVEEGGGKLRKVEENGGRSGKGISDFIVPEALKKKRLEELNRNDLVKILAK